MTGLELYKFIDKYQSVEYHYISDDEILVFIYHFLVSDFGKILDGCDEPFDCVIRSDYMVINIVPICDYYGIDYEKIFDKEE